MRFLADFAPTSRGPDLTQVTGRKRQIPLLRFEQTTASLEYRTCSPTHTPGVRVGFEFDPAATDRSDLRLDLLPADGLPSESWRYRWLR